MNFDRTARRAPADRARIKVTFILPNGERTTLDAPAGASILDVAHENDVDLEGACEGSVACSTCHVIVDPEYYAKMEEPDDEENDMLDLAFGVSTILVHSTSIER